MRIGLTNFADKWRLLFCSSEAMLSPKEKADKNELRQAVKKFFWFSLNQWIATIILTSAILATTLVLNLRLSIAPIPPLDFEWPLDWLVLISFSAVLFALTKATFLTFRLWSRNPIPAWYDVAITSSIFAVSIHWFFKQPHTFQLESLPLLQLSLLVILARKMYVWRQTSHTKKTGSVMDDSPLENYLEEDRFNRKAFLAMLSSAICQSNGTRSRVIALTGSWGTGKTSVLHAVRKSLPASHEGIWIDSWQFRNTGKLIEILVSSIAQHIRKYVLLVDSTRFIRRFTALISPATPMLKPYLEEIIKMLVQGDETDQLKKRLEQLVQATGKSFVVFLDDLERLNEEEIHDVLKVVRLALAIPTTTYVLAYDKLQLLKAAGPKFSEDFLDKIIDEEFEMPSLTKADHLKYLNELLDPSKNLTPEHKLVADIKERWPAVLKSLSKILDTPRKVKRVSVPIARLDPKLLLEINPLDFLLLEVLRQQNHSLFLRIKSEPQLFWQKAWTFSDVSTPYAIAMNMRNPDADKEEERRNNILSQVGEHQKHVEVILESLFPKSADREDCLRLRRICHPDCFDGYFTLSYLHATSPQVVIESLVKNITLATPSEQQKLIVEFLVQDDFEATLQNFNQLILFEADFPESILQSITEHIAEATRMCKFSDLQENLRFQVVAKNLVAKLVERLPDDEIATKVVVNVIKNASDVYFAGQLNRLVRLAGEKFNNTFGDRKPDMDQCQTAFEGVVERILFAENVDIFGFPRDTWFLIVTDYHNETRRREAVFARLKDHPNECVHWLGCWFNTRWNTEHKHEFDTPDYPPQKAYKIPLLKEVYEILVATKDKFTVGERETALIEGFISWYKPAASSVIAPQSSAAIK